MRRFKVSLMLPLVALAALALCAASAADTKPLEEQDLTTLVKVLDEATVVRKVQEHGVAFEIDDATLDRLKTAGVPEAVLDAVKQAAKGRQTAKTGPAITYEDITRLLELKIDESVILERLKQSPTVFTLDAGQVRELKAKGASDRLISAMQRQRAADPTVELSNLAVILDCSGSMLEKTADGRTKMEAAKEVVTDLVRRIPDGLHVTFVIYGHDKPLGCKAVKIVRPLSELDPAGKDDLVKLIAGLQPAGNTPIALALKTAGQELAKDKGPCGVVLISDGKETCHGDPKAEAATLARTLDLKPGFGVNVIGFGVNADERASLEEIARAGKGGYFHAETGEKLYAAVEELGGDEPLVQPKRDDEGPAIVRTKSLITAVVVNPLTLKGFPAIKEVYVIKAGGNPQAATFHYGMIIQRTKQFGKAMPLVAGKYDVIVEPAEGMRIALITNVEVNARETVTIHTNRVAAAVVVPKPDLDLSVKRLCAVPAGFSPNNATFDYGGVRQQCTGFGKPMLVTAGESFDIVMESAEGQRATIFEKVAPKAGKLLVLGVDDGPAE